MKQYLLGAALILACTPALANPNTNKPKAVNQTTNLTGVYAGVYGGYDWTDGTADVDGREAGVFAGYKLDRVMGWSQGVVFGGNTAIEGFYGLSDASGSGFSKDDEWGISFRPGLSVLDSVTSEVGINPYMILGYRNTKLDSATSSERYNGFELGVGTQLIAFGNAGIRVDYSHIWYGTKNGIDPESDNLRLGLSYHF